MIEVEELTKRYGRHVAVDHLTFRVEPGQVTAFLGPNGSGKTTTLRMVLGLTAPTSGTALVHGRPFTASGDAMHEVGALLDAGAAHPGRRARDHLRCLARAGGIGDRRVDEVLELTGLAPAGARRVAGFSLGMRQRLGLAAALLGDPPVLVLDEPGNGLDPDGSRWLRTILAELAAEGRAVLVSTHLMSEVERLAARVVVIGRGRLIADTTVEDLLAPSGPTEIRVGSPRPTELTGLLISAGGVVAREPDGALAVSGLTAARIAETAAEAGIPIHELTVPARSLEDAFMALTDGEVVHRSAPRALP